MSRAPRRPVDGDALPWDPSAVSEVPVSKSRWRIGSRRFSFFVALNSWRGVRHVQLGPARQQRVHSCACEAKPLFQVGVFFVEKKGCRIDSRILVGLQRRFPFFMA